MKSDIDIEDALYAYLNDSNLVTTITGELRKGEYERTKKSTKEDAIIAVTTNLNGEIQLASANVNIYVHDVWIGNEHVANKPRLRVLCDLAKEILEVINVEGYRITLESQRVVDCNATHEHCICNKLEYQFYNRQ